MGLPVLVTEETNLGTIVDQGQAGWWVPSTPKGASLDLRQVLGRRYPAARSEGDTWLPGANLTWRTIAAHWAQGVGTVLDRRRGRT